MSTQPAEPMNGKMSDLRFIDGGLKRARFADKTATFFFLFHFRSLCVPAHRFYPVCGMGRNQSF